MDPDTLRQAVEQAGVAAAGIGFLAGLFLSVNPVAFGAIPVSLAYLTRARERTHAILFGAMFILGMIVAHGLLGLIASLSGRWVESLAGRQWGLVLGPLLIVMGLLWPGWVRLRLPSIAFRAWKPIGSAGAFLLGGAFSVAICPACSPALVVLLGVTAGIGSPVVGVVLLLAFAIGRAVPIAAGAAALSSLEHLRALAAYRRAFEAAGGLLLIASGLYMLNAYYFWIPELAI